MKALTGAIVGCLLVMFAVPARAGITELVSVGASGYYSSISADGRFVAFEGPAHGILQSFVRDRLMGTTEEVGVSSSGEPADSNTDLPVISADGRFVAFRSYATNLVPDDTNGLWDIFVHDRSTGTTERVSVSSDGDQADGDSGFAAYDQGVAISGDGRFVAFVSQATNLVPDDTNTCGVFTIPGSCPDVFLRDRQLGTTERLSVDYLGREAQSQCEGPVMTPDGRFVGFTCMGPMVPSDTNGPGVQDAYLRDRLTGTIERVSETPSGGNSGGTSWIADISDDGRYVSFISSGASLVPGDTNGVQDLFVKDRTTGVIERVSVASDGTQANGDTISGGISSDGRFVGFLSLATNLVPGDTNTCGAYTIPGSCPDVFVHNRVTGLTIRVSVDSTGAQGDGSSHAYHGAGGGTIWYWYPSMTSDSRIVAFASAATNLVPDDTNGLPDVFVRIAECGDGVVDPGEDCDLGPLNGASDTCCTVDCGLRAAGERCRAAAGVCDVAETCTQTSGDCPPDAVASPSTVCRPAAGECDVAESCDGVGKGCPPNAFKGSGVLCTDDGDLCSQDFCDGAGTCDHAFAPLTVCKAPILPEKATLALADKTPDTGDSLKWKWSKGAVTAKAEFGDPTASTGYTLCIYDETGGTPSRALEAEVPAGGTCGTQPCWKATKGGFKYKNSAGTPAGTTGINLKEGLVPGKASIAVKGKGINLDMPMLPLHKDPAVTVQLRTSTGACWGAHYHTATKTDSTTFKAKSD